MRTRKADSPWNIPLLGKAEAPLATATTASAVTDVMVHAVAGRGQDADSAGRRLNLEPRPLDRHIYLSLKPPVSRLNSARVLRLL